VKVLAKIFYRFEVNYSWKHIGIQLSKKFSTANQVDAFLEELEVNSKRINKEVSYSVTRL